MNQITLKVGAAVIAGCTVVIKPSEESPLSAQIFAECIDKSGFPPGVINMVHGTGLGTGTMLTVHKDVDLVSFTGSPRAAKAIMANAATTLKRVALELGGKGANLVFADADADAVKRGVTHCMNNSGQSCNAPTRMMVEKSFYPEAVKIAKDVASKISVSSAFDESSSAEQVIGPVVNKMQFEKINDYIRIGMEEDNAELIIGGPGRPDGLDSGFFVKPTIFANVNNDMKIARDEIFGPVLCIMPFETEEEAIETANDTVYGLTNYIQTTDEDKAYRVSKRLRSGMVVINGKPRGKGAPFGGMKQSGQGREGGLYGIEDFLEIKSVAGSKPVA